MVRSIELGYPASKCCLSTCSKKTSLETSLSFSEESCD